MFIVTPGNSTRHDAVNSKIEWKRKKEKNIVRLQIKTQDYLEELMESIYIKLYDSI